MKCHIPECGKQADPNGGVFCELHRKWTAGLMRRCVLAIEQAITDDDGLDGLVGEKILHDLGHWPPRPGLNGGRTR